MKEILLQALPTVFGGLAIFIFGMTYMGEGLQKAAGEKMRNILQILTINPFVGVLVGTIVTCVIQSSSATTVMVVGFVSAGLVTLRQAIGVIMGANIGTTITAWLVSIKISDYAYPIAFVGFVLLFFIANAKVKSIGQVVFGFGVLFVGLNVMSDAMKPLAQSPDIENLMLSVSGHPVLGMTIGAVITGVVQSSSAVVAVVQKLAAATTADGSALISLGAAMPLVLGSNIGTTITAQLASLGATRSAKRSAWVHTIFNIGGSILFLFLLHPAEWLVTLILGSTSAANMDVAIATFHTIFNVSCTILFFPFIAGLEKLACMLIPEKAGEEEAILAHIDTKVMHTPAIAMDLAVKELVRMGGITRRLVEKAREALVTRSVEAHEEAFRLEDLTDTIKSEVVAYLSRILSVGSLTPDQSVRLTGLMHMAHDVERIGDNARSIAKISRGMVEKKQSLSDEAVSELSEAFDEILSMIDDTVRAYDSGDMAASRLVIEKEDRIDSLERVLREKHIERLNRGACSPESAITYVELIHYIERMSDSCKNIAESVLDDITHRLFGVYDKPLAGAENAG